VSKISPIEIRALDRIIDELDYYQLLHVEQDASTREVRRAYHETSRTFHPDTNRSLEPDLIAACQRIAKRVTEAYCVLRDRRRRRAYDQLLDSGGGHRIQLAEARAADAKQSSEERQGKTPQGRQFFQKASEDMARSDWAGAEQNIKMALTFEPGNAIFKERLEDIRKHK
jgi:DnaJ-class molecular chaperone